MIDFNALMCIHHIYRIHMTINDIESCVELYVQVLGGLYTNVTNGGLWKGKSYVANSAIALSVRI